MRYEIERTSKGVAVERRRIPETRRKEALLIARGYTLFLTPQRARDATVVLLANGRPVAAFRKQYDFTGTESKVVRV